MAAVQGLGGLGEMLLSGDIKIVDLSAVLGPKTPLLKLPPELAVDTPPIEIHKISEYDKNGPWWAWNWLKLGEHSGTHFDAPQHWITGKDYPDGATDSIPVKNFVAPVNVIDCSAEVASDPDYLLTADRVRAWEAEHGEIKAGEWGRHAHRLVQAQQLGGGVLECRRQRPPFARAERRLHRARHHERCHWLGYGMHRHGCRSGRGDGPALPCPPSYAQEQPLRPCQPVQPRPTAAQGRRADRGPAQD